MGNAVVKMNLGGFMTEYAVPTAASGPLGITLGPDGALWFTEALASKIGRITVSGSVTEFSIPAGRGPTGIVTGADGNLWFMENGAGKIGRMTTSGGLTEFDVTNPSRGFWPTGIVALADGSLWFAGDSNLQHIDAFGTVIETIGFANPNPFVANDVTGIAMGPTASGTGLIPWFTILSGKVVGYVAVGP
jgi:virginiamycin B lyase